jgi:hypothetical protein
VKQNKKLDSKDQVFSYWLFFGRDFPGIFRQSKILKLSIIYQSYFKLEKICFGIWGSPQSGARFVARKKFKIFPKSKGLWYSSGV